MSIEPLVSVVLPAYNAEKYIQLAVDSILYQTYGSVELIVVDDGSIDSTYSILKAIKDCRLKIIKNDKNLGLIESLNRGVQYSSGKYIARMDADDISYPDRLKKQVDFLEHNIDIDVLGTDMMVVDDKLTPVQLPIPLESIPEKIQFLAWTGPIVFHPTIMARAEVLKINPYLEENKYYEDFALWNRLLLKGHKFSNLCEPLLSYRRHSNSVSIVRESEQSQMAASFIQGLIKEKHQVDITFDTACFMINPFYPYTEDKVKGDLIYLTEAIPDTHFMIGRMSVPYLLRTRDIKTFVKILKPNFFFDSMMFWIKKAIRLWCFDKV